MPFVTYFILLFSLFVATPALVGQQAKSPALSEGITWQAHEFKLNSNEFVTAELGELDVPENRNAQDSRTIRLRFIKLSTRAKNPVSPILYLAGGPGGSGISAARGPRWEMFDRLRDLGDVILLDQRGTGISDGLPAWNGTTALPSDVPLTPEMLSALMKSELEKAVEFWESQGADYRGYTTAESAADIDAIRAAMGVRRFNLLGISYGTHLALATVKAFPESVDRLVLVSAEGLDHTVKLPSRTDQYFERLQAAIDQTPEAAAKYPDIRALMTRVLEKVDAAPPVLTLRSRSGRSGQYVLGRFDMQRIAGFMISDPARVEPLLKAFKDADEGSFAYFQWFLGTPVQVRGMPELMDIASGISEPRLRLFEAQAEESILGEALNFPMPRLRKALPELDLSDAFRLGLESDRPTLFFSGTLDGRTYPESHAEIASGFTNHTIVTVENAGHNLFFSHPQVVPLIADFFAGKAIESTTLTASLPTFTSQ